MTYTINTLSASTDGQPIEITGITLGAANTVHTAGASNLDEVYIFATNTTASPITVTTLFGGVAATDAIVNTINANSSKMIVQGAPLQNSKVAKVYASAVGINVYGKAGTIS